MVVQCICDSFIYPGPAVAVDEPVATAKDDDIRRHVEILPVPILLAEDAVVVTGRVGSSSSSRADSSSFSIGATLEDFVTVNEFALRAARVLREQCERGYQMEREKRRIDPSPRALARQLYIYILCGRQTSRICISFSSFCSMCVLDTQCLFFRHMGTKREMHVALLYILAKVGVILSRTGVTGSCTEMVSSSR